MRSFFGDNSEMAKRINAHEWSLTPIGPPDHWPLSLKINVYTVLATQYPSILLWGNDLVVCAYNDAYRPMLGQKPEALGRPFLEVWSEAAEIIKPQLNEALQGKACFFKQAPFVLVRNRQPEQTYFDYCFSPIRDEEGTIIGILNTAIESTGEVNTFRQLRESEERFRTALNVSKTVVFEHDTNLRYIKVFNPHPGFKAEDVLGKTDQELLNQDDALRLTEIKRRVLNGGQPMRSIVQTTIGGKTFYYDLIVNPVHDDRGNIIGISCASTDITERKTAEENLLESKNRLSTDLGVMERLLHIGSLFVGNKDLQEIMAEIVEAALFITGTDMGNLQIYDPQSDSLKIIAHRGFDKAWLDFWESVKTDEHGACGKAIKTRDRIIVEDVTQSEIFMGKPALDIQLAAGVRAVQSTPLVGRSGRPLGMISTHFRKPHRPSEQTLCQIDALARHATDIIERAQAEEKNRELERQLRQAQKIETLGNLAGGIAHEFNNILSIIMGNNELVMSEIPTWNPLRDHLEEIRAASLRASDVVKQLLTFARRSDSQKEPMSIVDVVQDSLKLIRSIIPANIEIQEHLPECIDPVLCNSTQINQLMINLCSNAADAMLAAGGLLTVEMQNVTFDAAEAHLHDLKPGAYVKLMISDNGFGMDSKTLEHLFEPYFTTKEFGKGTGIGLAVVHGIVEQHKGKISVESKLGQGTIFIILLPAFHGDVREETSFPIDLPRGHEKILFIDDEASLVKTGQLRLKSLGYHVTGTTDSGKALAMVKADPSAFDLVITDMAMPNMTGEQLAEEMLKIRPDMPIMLCTGYSEKISENRARKLGTRAFLMKPIGLAELARSIRKILD